MPRLAAVDALRGLIMVAMALDHANYFIAKSHVGNEFWFIPAPSYPTALDFLTRIVTHLAAPGFFFLMGVGLSLFAASRLRAGWTTGAITRHFAFRGFLLIALQLLIENRAWPIALPSGSHFSFTWYMGVLFGLGGALVFASVLIRLPSFVLAPLGITLISISNYFLSDTGNGEDLNPLRALFLTAGSGGNLNVYYPILPWLGVVLLGITFARLFIPAPTPSTPTRTPFLWSIPIGALLLTLFFLLRTLNLGDPHPPASIGWMPFLNVTKYPPSFDFLLITLGIDLILLGLFAALLSAGRRIPIALHPLLTFGRTPLFFYLLHLFLYAGIGVLFTPNGTTLQTMYPLWLLGLLILYPLCWLYGAFKSTRPANSPWRFL